MYFIFGSYYHGHRLTQLDKTPHHLREKLKEDCLQFFELIQLCDSPLIGLYVIYLYHVKRSLTGVLLAHLILILERSKTLFWQKIKDIQLSPSFYLPCNIIVLSKHAGNDRHEYLLLASQFQCLEAWSS